MMPYLKDRPMSLNRFPGGIHGQSFYQKNVTDKAPDWAKTFDHVTDEGKVTKYLVGTDEASLLMDGLFRLYRDQSLVQPRANTR